MEQLDLVDYMLTAGLSNNLNLRSNILKEFSKEDSMSVEDNIDSEVEVILSKSVVSENLFPGFSFEDVREINSI